MDENRETETAFLSPIEARVLGCLLEKEKTTPANYPLSLNALTNACNQKSNRKPVYSFTEQEVRGAADTLREKKLVMMVHGAGARVPKFRHTLQNRFELENSESAILCELLLRGPQTPGELRARCERMYLFADLPAVDRTLDSLINYPVTPLVARLPRKPGQKEERFRQLLELQSDEAESDRFSSR